MGTITGTAILANVVPVVEDLNRSRWPDPEPLNWINDGQRYIVMQRPDANAQTANIALVAGTRQSLPAAGLRLIDVTRNMGAGGATPGKAITLTERDVLDRQNPNWHASAQAAAIAHYIYDNRDPKIFFVYPAAVAGINIEAIYSTSPTDLAGLGSAISLDDIYAPILTDYLLYRMYLKDAEFVGDPSRAAFHLNAVNAALGIKTKIDVAVSPNQNLPGHGASASMGAR